jgi:KDO2-lipid IV(A) lauroyltransferase
VKRIAFALEAGLVRTLLAALRLLSPSGASNLGGFVATRIGPLLPVSRVADANLRAAMPELSAADRRRIVRGVWDNLGRTVAEFPHLSSLRRTETGPGYEVVNEHVLIEAAQAGGPALFASGHIGNWEVMPPVLDKYGISMAAMYRAATNPHIDDIVRGLRGSSMPNPPPVFPKGTQGARAALAHLSRRGYLGMLVDQKLNEGIEARLFGLPAMTTPALAAFALRYRCRLIPGHVQRTGPARFRLIVENPMDLPDSGDRQRDVAALTQSVNDVLEAMIRARPESWLWLHRRWPKDVVQIERKKESGSFLKKRTKKLFLI